MPVMGSKMKNKWMKIILVASLAFNLAFLSTALYKKFSSPGKRPVEKAKDTLETEFKLQKEQKEEIKEIMNKFRISMMGYKQDILVKRMAIIEAMNDPEFNTQDIEKKTGQLNELENRLNLAFVDALVRINNILNAKQRSDFLLRLSKNWFFIKDHSSSSDKGGHRD